ncbi:hypothetical protein [Microbacterium sp.]|uniref:hypothetical protein n=1 Tax=Microbacterium sp. TaxID=51671 RepID=UPI0028AD2F2B|nr:hypothetical protein [Microbacterium sp.]
MSLMEQVRDLGAEQASLGDRTVTVARAALMREVRRRTRERRRIPRWAGVGIGGVVAGTAVTAIVVGSVLAPSTAPSASAAEVLRGAARTTLTTTALDPAPGQYIRIQEVSTQTLGWRADPDEPDGGVLDSTEQATSLTLQISRSLYVPQDRSQDWVEDYAESKEVLSASGPDVTDATRAALEPDGLGVQIYPAGLYSEPDAVEPDDMFHRNALECYYDVMPREPQRLVRWLEANQDAPRSTCAPPRLGEPIEFNLAPADLRAAMFQALAQVEGARVERVEGDITTIAFPEGGESAWMQTVDVDTSQGIIVGRGALEDELWSSRVFVTIVDEIPASVQLP